MILRCKKNMEVSKCKNPDNVSILFTPGKEYKCKYWINIDEDVQAVFTTDINVDVCINSFDLKYIFEF